MGINLAQRWMYSPWYCQLVVTRKCNLSCGYCNEYDKVSDPVPIEDLKHRAKRAKELGTFAINFTGGEPTMHPDFPELVRYCRKELKFLQTTTITNGFYLNKELIEKLNDAGLQAMQISIDGVKVNDTTVKVLDSLRKRLGYLKEYAKFRVVVSGVIGSRKGVTTGSLLVDLDVSEDGRFLFGADLTGDVIWRLAIDEVAGALTVLGSPGPSTEGPAELARAGRFLYMTNRPNGFTAAAPTSFVFGYATSEGALTLLPGFPVRPEPVGCPGKLALSN